MNSRISSSDGGRRARGWAVRGAVAVLAAAAGSAWPAASAHAGPHQLSVVMEDNLLIYGTDQERTASLASMKSIGVDAVRVSVSWNFLAGPSTNTPAERRGFRGDLPSSYSPLLWNRFDRLLRDADAIGVLVYLNIGGPGPPAFHGFTRDVHARLAYKPRPFEFFKFVRAVGRRYSGSYVDENEGRRVLPRVGVWSIWNEPNQQATLTPQSEYSPLLRRVIPVAPIIYRDLYVAATRALELSGHARDVVLMGETAPLGKTVLGPRVHIRPKLFMREFFCIGPGGRPYSGLEARARRCDVLTRNAPLMIGGFAHHPYTQRFNPFRRDAHRDSINFGNIGELPILLDDLAAKTRAIPRNLPVWLTEAGWQTRPDPIDGIAPVLQADYLNLSDHIAYDQPRIVAQTQFLLRDVHPRADVRRVPRLYWSTWQSGLLYADGRPKPSLAAYRLPFDLRRRGPRGPNGAQALDLWGQVRFLPYGRASRVEFQFRPAGSASWSTAGAREVTNPQGFYEAQVVASGPGTWRAIWGEGGRFVVSRPILVT